MADELSNNAMIVRRFDEFNDEGWWHQENGETYVKLYDRLVELGVPAKDAYEVLSTAYWAAADEYGA